METVAYKCINCGGPLQYSPEKLKFACEYCRSDFTEDELKSHYGDLDRNLENSQSQPEPVQSQSGDEFSMNAALYVCENCGAEIIADKKTTAATFCVYCHSPVVISNRLAGEFKPDLVIPFKISEQDAKNKFMEFVKKKRFLPSDFVSDANLEHMKGVYYPYWLIDSLKDGGIEAKAKKIKHWTEGDYRYTETKIYSVKRKGKIDFKGFPFSALKDTEHHKALKFVNPYKDSELRPFTMSYLSGFLAEKRDVERSEVQRDVDNELREYAKKIYLDTVEGYDSVELKNISLNTKREKWNYAMMPVWFMNYKYKDKNYIYAMNGQTGKTFGELPVSGKKLAFFGIGLCIVLFLAILLGGYFLL